MIVLTYSLHSNCRHLASNKPFPLNPIHIILTKCRKFSYLPSVIRIFHPPLKLGLQNHIQTPILCSKKKKARYGYRKFARILPKFFFFAGSSLRILPPPLDLVIGEFSEDVGGGSAFVGRRMKWKMNFEVLGFFVFYGIGLLLFGTELKSDKLGVWILKLGSIGVSLTRGFKKAIKRLILGLLVLGFLIILGLSKHDRSKLAERFSVCGSVLEICESIRKKR